MLTCCKTATGQKEEDRWNQFVHGGKSNQNGVKGRIETTLFLCQAWEQGRFNSSLDVYKIRLYNFFSCGWIEVKSAILTGCPDAMLLRAAIPTRQAKASYFSLATYSSM